MITSCHVCKHGSVNVSKQFECWRFYREDGDSFHIEMREKHAADYNRNGMCLYFELKEKEQTMSVVGVEEKMNYSKISNSSKESVLKRIMSIFALTKLASYRIGY